MHRSCVPPRGRVTRRLGVKFARHKPGPTSLPEHVFPLTSSKVRLSPLNPRRLGRPRSPSGGRRAPREAASLSGKAALARALEIFARPPLSLSFRASSSGSLSDSSAFVFSQTGLRFYLLGKPLCLSLSLSSAPPTRQTCVASAGRRRRCSRRTHKGRRRVAAAAAAAPVRRERERERRRKNKPVGFPRWCVRSPLEK